ncbi:MAG: hypothetical protein SPG50_07280 [Muribaculaceae bacterium]|nr:hypothetical protein [Muribaculaceae bacterium]
MKFKTVFCFVAGMLLLTGCSGGSNTKAMAETTTVIESVAEPVYLGNDKSKEVEAATAGEVKIEKGANLVAVLRGSKGVTYEYNADSGIWAHVGNVSIIIDEDQLNAKGIEFINSILSDIEPNLAFSPDYLKPDAKILQIEKE